MNVPKTIDFAPTSWGGPLSEDDYIALERSWISREYANAAMLRRVDSQTGREVIGQKGHRDCAGILIPYRWPGDQSPFNYRLRRDNPDLGYNKAGKPKLERKYLGAPGSGNRLYIAPGVTSEQLQDISIPIVLVEGEKKALALWRLANHEVAAPRFIPIAIGGVWSWIGIIGKLGGPKGERLDVKGPIADLGRIAWNGRKTYILFDTNVHTNDSVQWARKGIARELGKRGAKVDFVTMPVDCGVNGIDDLLAAWGPTRVLLLFENSMPAARLEVKLPPQFEARPDGMFRVKTAGTQISQIQLTNYQAIITTNLRVDDGVEVKQELEIEAELLGRRATFTVPASKFAGMEWAIEQLGGLAITYPNQKDYARTAIQSLSVMAKERVVYSHTGWRKIDDQWIYLYAGGAIGSAGFVNDIDVRLFGSLAHYELQLPCDANALSAAIRANLKLVELGPASISFPLLAATYRAIFGNADFALHLVGETGAFKSELAAVHQQHFGAAMHRLNLPGAWSSTANALEALAFQTKDALFVIDDFAPQGNSTEMTRYHAAADRVFRAAGNSAGRIRLDSSANLRQPKPPRALILSTGEDVPRGQSIRARLLILELAKGDINPSRLTACQKDAQTGLYAQALGGFLQWMACNHEQAWAAFTQRVADFRATAHSNAAHARTPDILANLQAAFEMFLMFAQAVGCITLAEGIELSRRCWDALGGSAKEQAKHHRANEPATMFLRLVRSTLTSGKSHLAGVDGRNPGHAPESCGWRRDAHENWIAQGDCIGWITEDDIYLESGSAYRVASVAARDVGEAITVTEQTLNKRLKEKALLASTDAARETLTIRKKIGGSSKSVLHFRRDTILPSASDAHEDAD